MARAATMLLIVACCAVLATAVYAGDECSGVQKYKFKYFEQLTKEEKVFGPTPSNGKIGEGRVYDNRATKEYAVDSELLGYDSGLYYYTSATDTQEVMTIFFRDFNEKGGTFVNAELHVRGLWILDSHGEDLHVQELSIVGGKGGLSGAYGTVEFTRLGEDVWLVQGTVFLDETRCRVQRNANIAQVIGA